MTAYSHCRLPACTARGYLLRIRISSYTSMFLDFLLYKSSLQSLKALIICQTKTKHYRVQIQSGGYLRALGSFLAFKSTELLSLHVFIYLQDSIT